MFTLSSGEKHTRESGEMVFNLEPVGALQIVVPTNARETRPETCGALPIRVLTTSVSRIIIAFGRYAFETALVRCGPAPAGWKREMTCFARAACHGWVTSTAKLSCAEACRLDHVREDFHSPPAASIRHPTNWVLHRVHGLPLLLGKFSFKFGDTCPRLA
jgi:hypothetical protein